MNILRYFFNTMVMMIREAIVEPLIVYTHGNTITQIYCSKWRHYIKLISRNEMVVYTRSYAHDRFIKHVIIEPKLLEIVDHQNDYIIAIVNYFLTRRATLVNMEEMSVNPDSFGLSDKDVAMIDHIDPDEIVLNSLAVSDRIILHHALGLVIDNPDVNPNLSILLENMYGLLTKDIEAADLIGQEVSTHVNQ